MSVAQIELPPKLIPVFEGEAEYRGAFGGRGSAKTRSFAKMAAVFAYRKAKEGVSGVVVCGREYMNSLDESSMAEIKAAIESEPWLLKHFDIGEKYIRTLDRRVSFEFVGLRHNLDSIKSKAKILLLWIDEAEPVSDAAYSKAIPTVREEGAEIWVTWNPEREQSATHKRFRLDPPKSSKIVEMNWQDNPWFPKRLNSTRLEDQEKRPDTYGHIWDGEFVTAVEGAYYSPWLTKAKQEGRIGFLAADPLMTIRAWWDIGGTGAKADACAIWVGQFIGQEIRILDYYEAVGQELSEHVGWLRRNGYGKALCVLPHDGNTNDKVQRVSYASALRQAEFEVKVQPNAGAGAANARIEAVRRVFPSIRFNEDKTKPGRDALGWYHEKRDPVRGIGLGPNHDWSSHPADAFGVMAIDKATNHATTTIDFTNTTFASEYA